MNITILIEKLENLTNKKVILEDDSEYQSKYFKPVKLDERLLKVKEEMDKNIFINGKELTYKGDVEIKELKIFEKFYSKYIIDVKGFVNISKCNLKEIPVQFGYVGGNFSCGNNQLISLKGSPYKVKGAFSCNNNKLTSLENCPVDVFNFDCSNNQLTSLKNGPEEVLGVYICSNNLLISLEGCPKEVGSNFNCWNNKLISLKGSPVVVMGRFHVGSNLLTSLKGSPKFVNGNFVCHTNKTVFTKEYVRKNCDVGGQIIIS